MPNQWNAAILMLAITACFAARKSSSILDPMACYLLAIAHGYHILIPIVARYGPSELPRSLFTGNFLHRCCLNRCRRIVAYGEGKLGILRQPRWSLQTGRYARKMRWNSTTRTLPFLRGRLSVMERAQGPSARGSSPGRPAAHHAQARGTLGPISV